ncbi:hypothetical protein WA026_009597 [Henosepilachna vigintioctopunctata]|uniref:PNT domain-containing protein n=1 Tax=Henosepilachna vigintioctopunctata TaxID=420089 RepID=A0AAW1U565_9CUCU
MKLVPGPLPPIPTGAAMDRLPLPMPFSPDLLWRYPLGFSSIGQQPPSSPLLDYKSQLPTSLASDPRVWSRDDVVAFLRWAEREFDIQPIDLDMFQMNGKAMCLLTRTDLGERAPGSGDVLYNVLQILVREANNLQRMLPSSPVTPTSRHSYPISPISHPPTPNWNVLAQSNGESFQNPHTATLAAHLLAHSNSVTLSPAPSMDSQNGSPQHSDNHQSFSHTVFSTSGSNGSGSNPSDSDEDEKKWNQTSPPNTPTFSFSNHSVSSAPPRSPKETNFNTESYMRNFGRDFFPMILRNQIQMVGYCGIFYNSC